MKILGIDPGLATVGFGLLSVDRGQPRMLSYGVIRTPPELSLPRRLLMIADDMQQLLARSEPDHVAVEELFFSKNITTGLPVAHARGVILLEAARCGLPVFTYTPMQVKQGVVGYGKAEKRQVIALVSMLLSLDKPPRPDDAADALAVALCHAQAYRSRL